MGADLDLGAIQVHHGDCREVLAGLPDCSVDSVVTDPPYELGFMGKAWDASGIAYSVEMWGEVLRVLKPGGHLLAFGGTRTYHRMAVAIEDAGFKIRDSIHWLYGSGFPKSLDVSKAIDKDNGRKFEDRYPLADHIRQQRKAAGFTAKQVNEWFGYSTACQHWESRNAGGARVPSVSDYAVLKERLGLGDEFDELVARAEAEREVVGTKKTGDPVAWYAEQHRGDGVVNITAPATDAARRWNGWGTALKPAHEPIVVARKPLEGTVAANVLAHGTGALNIDGCRVPTDDRLPTAGGQRVTTNEVYGTGLGVSSGRSAALGGRWPANVIVDDSIDDDWARYFYCAKPSKRERTCEGTVANGHPTLKPLELMRYLVRLVTPPGGTVLEPFAGSGTTLMACAMEGFHGIGIEMTDDYLPIIEGRVRWAQSQHQELTLDLG